MGRTLLLMDEGVKEEEKERVVRADGGEEQTHTPHMQIYDASLLILTTIVTKVVAFL